MDRRFFLRRMMACVVGGVGMAEVIGCRGSEPLTLFSRKSLRQQQREAEYFDPLPSPDAGPNPPGLRLKGMEIPAPEPVRAVADPIHAFEYVEEGENAGTTTTATPTY